MRYFIFLFLAFFTFSCSKQPVYVAMPSFPIKYDEQKIKADAVGVSFGEITLEKDSDYSEFFKQSSLKLRIDEELSSLNKNMKAQINNMLIKKGYKLDDNASLVLNIKLKTTIKESFIDKDAKDIKSKLLLALKVESKLDDSLENTQLLINNQAGFDNPIPIEYTSPSINYVPTLFDESLYPSLFAIDDLILNFYREFLINMQNTIPAVKDGKTPQLDKKNEPQKTPDTKAKEEEEIIIF